MPRVRSPNRGRAYELWKESGGTRELKDIAEELGVSPEQVRKWKHADAWGSSWEKERDQTGKVTLPKGNGHVTKSKRRRGGQPRNQNAEGNTGGAPVRNRNALKHGGYSKLYLDTLTEEERAAIASGERDTEQLLLGEIDLLSIRERRIMVRIRELSGKDGISPDGDGLALAGTIRSEEKREFDTPEDRTIYEETLRGQVESGERLPGRKYTLTTRTEAAYDIIHRLEDALTRCQAQKQRLIKTLMELRREQAANQTEIEDLDSVEAAIYGEGD
ncbi:MAG: hypothetical protein IJT94_15470 [Oscillibacter sp.]|nr:hypothetical protein [Oscillibacter sp.]